MATLTPEQIKSVKGLGCLQDKRYEDVFNVRVITRNGRITTDEVRSIAEAADKFGSGKVAMTSRLTIEIQGVKYENIEPMIAFLQERAWTAAAPVPRFVRSSPARVPPASTALSTPSPSVKRSMKSSTLATTAWPCPTSSRLP